MPWTRDIANMNFRFRSKSQPIQYTNSLALMMQLLPAELSVAGSTLFYRFSPEEISALGALLTPENMILTVISKTFQGTTDQVSRVLHLSFNPFFSVQRLYPLHGNLPVLFKQAKVAASPPCC